MWAPFYAFPVWDRKRDSLSSEKHKTKQYTRFVQLIYDFKIIISNYKKFTEHPTQFKRIWWFELLSIFSKVQTCVPF
jgi:hypothetical protein